jgi:acyl-ACP thioesterase
VWSTQAAELSKIGRQAKLYTFPLHHKPKLTRHGGGRGVMIVTLKLSITAELITIISSSIISLSGGGKVGETSLRHRQQVVVRVNDVDFNLRIKPGAVMGFFQDIAKEHAEKLGLGGADMAAKNLFWVMVRMSFKILKNPSVGEKLTVETFFGRPKLIDTTRSYRIFNAVGETVISGASKWCVLDAGNYKPQRLAPFFEKFEDGDYTDEEPLRDANPKIEISADLLSEAEAPAVFSVGVTDLDQNLHMNNSRYGDIALNACGLEELKEKSIARFDVNFISQLFWGERYEVRKARTENAAFVEAKRAGTDDLIFRARIEWGSDTL